MKASQQLTIGEAAERIGIAPSVLRHWESEGLLAPARDAAGYRSYTEGDLVRIAIIHRNRQAGVSVERIRALLSGDSEGRRAVLREHLEELEARLAELERARAMTRHALGCPEHDVVACPRFRAFVDDLVEGRTELREMPAYFDGTGSAT